MKLTQAAIKKIDKQTRLKLALALNFSEVWILKLIAKNKRNGPLTTSTALDILHEGTGLEKEKILEDTKVQTEVEGKP